MPLQSFKSYRNDLFGDEEGDVLAGETIPAAKPIEVAVPRPTTPSGRVQQQIALNQQKRLARLQVMPAVFICVDNAQCVLSYQTEHCILEIVPCISVPWHLPRFICLSNQANTAQSS